jgi:hypothetical protein
MADWNLAFHESRPITVESCAHALSAVVGGPVTTDVGPIGGNPRDFYYRSVTVTAQRPGSDMRVEMRLGQSLRSPDDPEPLVSFGGVTLQAPAEPFAARLALWHALRDALAAIGCTDRTLAANPAPIVDDAEAAGETAIAARLRADITAALIAEIPAHRSVTLSGTRPDDIEAVLEAYLRPEDIVTVSFSDCGLQALPAAFARFPNISCLYVAEDGLDGRTLRGVSLPKLDTLGLGGARIRRVTKDDLAGFPALVMLAIQGSPLDELDPEIIEVCPKLGRVVIANTPLGRDDRKMSVLRARWKQIRWE